MTWRSRIATGLLWGLWAPAAIGGGMALAPLHALAALIAAPWGQVKHIAQGRVLWLAPIIAFLAWAALSMLWRLGPPTDQLPKTALGLLAAFGLCAALRHGSAPAVRLFLWAATGAIVLALGMGMIEALADLAINRIYQPEASTQGLERNPGKGVALLVLTAPAVAMWLALRPSAGRISQIGAGLIFAVLAYLTSQFGMTVNMVALAVVSAAATAAAIAPTWALRTIGLGLAALIVAAPAIYGLTASGLRDVALPESWVMRLDLWASAVDAIGARPFVGWGMDAARDLNAKAGYHMTLHPHGFGLQIWLELGWIGAVLAALCFGIGLWRLGGRLADDRLAAAAAAAVISAASVHASISFGAWQEWWLAAIGIAAALLSAITNRQGANKATFNR